MAFAFPWFLLALVPWAAVTLWLLVERPRRVRVPFLPLWRGPAAVPRQRSAIRWPPISLAAAMLAMLLAVLAAARPFVSDGAVARAITIIVDRGITMGTSSRMHQAAQAVAAELPGAGAVDLVLIPDGQLRRMDRTTWLAAVQKSTVSAADTTSTLASIVRARLQESAGVVLLISNRVVDMSDRRLVQVVPEGAMQNISIVSIAARAEPVAQVMVRVRNESAQAAATLAVACGDQRVSRRISLPGRGQEQAVFLDLPSLGPVVSAGLEVQDDIPADDQAFLVRQRSWPRIEPRMPLPSELGRMLEVYSAHRTPAEASLRVAIVADIAAAGDSPAVIVPATAPPATRPAHVRTADHPVWREADFAGALEEVRLAAAPPSGAWTPLMELDGQAAVAVRESPARQVWVGFASEAFARSPQFVVFWTNVLDWTGQGGESFGASLPQALGPGWRFWDAAPAAHGEPGFWPGVWVHPDGRMLAINAPHARLDDLAKPSEWRARLRQLQGPGGAGRDLSAALLVASLAALAVAALTWERRPSVWAVAAA